MAYTSAEVLTIIAAVGVLVTAIGGVIVNVIGAVRIERKVAQGVAVGDATLVETRNLIGKVEQVHTLTNSNLSAVKAELATATAQIVTLREMIQEMKVTRGHNGFNQTEQE